MKRLLQINVTANWGSTGRIAEDIGKLVIDEGWESFIAYGRRKPMSTSNLIRIGNDLDVAIHGISSRVFDNHGLASKRATRSFVKEIDRINPDVIHLHNIHGYYLNYPILFDYLKNWGGPVVWTLHDCWPFTGHCSYFDYVGCDKWQSQCRNCQLRCEYPKSYIFDNSLNNYANKKRWFNSPDNLTLVPVSNWLEGLIRKSFLRDNNIETIHNGIDISRFRPHYDTGGLYDKYSLKRGNPIVLGAASLWGQRKGLSDFIELRKILPTNIQIIMVGTTGDLKERLPHGIIGIDRTDSIEELSRLYSLADVFINPTWEDNYPTTNLEAISCGTPVITYDTGGSPESVNPTVGKIIPKNNVQRLMEAIIEIIGWDKATTSAKCKAFAEQNFDKNICFKKYIKLYNTITTK